MVAFSITDVGKALQRRWKLLAALGLAFTTYTLAGFFLVPWLAKSYVESYVRDDLKRQIAIGEISFNPFTFATDVRNFAISEADGSPIASFDLLRVDFSLSSIFNRTWTFAEVRLDGPQMRVLVGADGTLNLAKLVPPSTEPEPTEPASVPAVRIGTLAVHAGRVAFDDQSRGRPFNATLTPIEFTLTDFRTAPDFQNVYQFAASTLAGERLTWSGQFSVQPLGSTGKFAINAQGRHDHRLSSGRTAVRRAVRLRRPRRRVHCDGRGEFRFRREAADAEARRLRDSAQGRRRLAEMGDTSRCAGVGYDLLARGAQARGRHGPDR
jgi:uncharacterized protein involved in outer membrane biogenesis